MNLDYVLKQMRKALQTIDGAARVTGKSEPSPLEALARALDNFDVSKTLGFKRNLADWQT